MAEALLSSFLAALFDRLASPELLNFVRREGLQEKVDKWSKTLRRIQAVLDDADEKQDKNEGVKEWLNNLRDLAYDVDDILDEFATEALRLKLTEGDDQASTSKGLKRKLASLITGFTPTAVRINMRLGSEMEKITDRFNEMVKQKDDLKLSETIDRRSSRTSQILAPTSVVTEAHVYGREKDKEALLQFLVGEKHSDAQLSVLPIHGMGGMGKTTLAQLVYNDEQVQSFFELKAWTCVSEDFDAVRVTKTVLQFFSSENCEGKDLSWLQEKLKANLTRRKFLVILDDLWNEKYSDWTHLRAPFEAGAAGSAIVITTRNHGVSSKTGTIPTYSLKELSNDFCLSIFAHHALGTRDFSSHVNLEDIGEELVRRCKRSPLAAKVLGGVLRNKVDRDEWEDVLNSNIWDIAEVKNEIAPALMLCYHHLLSLLKRCFAYCSILPKDYVFEEKQLVLLWMAEGLIKPRDGGKQMEDLGREDFRNLLSRSFFQRSFNDESRFVMHDLINDLAQQVAGDICFRMEEKVGGNNEGKPSRKARHSSYLAGAYDGIKKFEVFNDLMHLRTFLPLLSQYSLCALTHNVPFQLLPKLKRLRVLSLKGYIIYELPKSIGDLKHLRFFNLSYTKIRSLPESVCALYNLQTLMLENCFFLKKLPSTFGNLLNLRHLNIRGAHALEGMPPQISKLTCLQTLPHLVVGKGSCSGVKLLGPLLHLRDTLCISRLENVINHEDARDANLFEKKNLFGVSFEWSTNIEESHDKAHELEVLNMLKPHEGLKELTINNYGGTKFPMWLRVPSFSNMLFLKIESCAKCISLPAVGKLPSLKEVLIKGMDSVKNIGSEFYGKDCSQPFRSLETLHFEDMQEWEDWIPCEEFPKLCKLSIIRCPKLMGKLPNHLPLLKNIEIHDCRQLLVSISSFPELCKLDIEGSKGVVCRNKVDFNSLRFWNLSTISEFTCQIEEFTIGGRTNVEALTIEDCEVLTNLRLNDMGLLQHLPYLGVLEIHDCPILVSLEENEVEEQLQLSLPSKLRKIRIDKCEALESLPKAMMDNNMHLEEVYISGCSSLTHFAIGQLPPTLKQLTIEWCINMQILVDGDDINKCSSGKSLLEYLDISLCPSLKSLTLSGELPATLKHLKIKDCRRLESIAKSFHDNLSLEVIRILCCYKLKSLPMGIHNLIHLDQFFIVQCTILDSFPDNGLLPTNLKTLLIVYCEKMQALPNCIHNLTSLQELRIWRSGSILSFPEVGFLTNLTSLSIYTMASFHEATFEWELSELPSLKELIIRGNSSHLVSFPEVMLPASLTSLTIENFPDLECISSKCFQFLASLEQLSIDSCKKLTSFLEDGLPHSLTSLSISTCEKLTSFPKNAAKDESGSR
ncbi:putative disease resistance RPP13-like protein 1 [Corylus avellana]|uniref:putative disease resistance RPP13-like protein 1 n=1 Tax=Corylus avellana TaxID=13451 RepID=UPI00286A3052|nr:putative disease resistance RPP13-like protein 1 [Corylus avellana]